MKKSFILLFTVVVFLGLAGLAFAEVVNLPNPLCPTGGGVNCTNDFPTLITKIATFIKNLIASLAVIVLVWAGILFVTSSGNEARLGTAKKALIYAVIGIAIALAADGLLGVIKGVLGVP